MSDSKETKVRWSWGTYTNPTTEVTDITEVGIGPLSPRTYPHGHFPLTGASSTCIALLPDASMHYCLMHQCTIAW